jgi:hypothetical protein
LYQDGQAFALDGFHAFVGGLERGYHVSPI